MCCCMLTADDVIYSASLTCLLHYGGIALLLLAPLLSCRHSGLVDVTLRLVKGRSAFSLWTGSLSSPYI